SDFTPWESQKSHFCQSSARQAGPFGVKPASHARSLALSKDLKQSGFEVAGAVTVHAFMQAVGMVDDHALACPRRAACRDAAH
ncbi:DNA-3-methyladenine glycosylase I, partial [Novosphingobium pokkalii]